MNAGHTDIEQTVDRVAHDLSRDARLLGHRQIRRAGCRNQDRAGAWLNVLLPKCNGSREGLEGRARYHLLDGREGLFGGACH